MTNPTAPQQPLPPQPKRHTAQSAARARADARASFDSLPDGVKRATWTHLDRLLADATWVFARTMAHNPHFYTKRRDWPDADFVWAVEMVRLLGERERYEGRWYIVLNRNGFKFWTMGWPVKVTILINRKVLPPAGNSGDA